MLFALLAIAGTRPALAQDMPPILAPLDLPKASVAAPSPGSAPSAEAVIPPAAAVPAIKPQAAIARPPAPDHHVAAATQKKFAALLKRLSPSDHKAVNQKTAAQKSRDHEAVRHVATAHETAPTAAEAARALPPGTVVMGPPGYYQPSPYRRLVYAGPYGGWGGGRHPYPYYDYR